MRTQHGVGGVFEEPDHEGSGKDVDPAVAHGVRRPLRRDDDADLGARSRRDVHGVGFYREKSRNCKPETSSSASMMATKARSLMRSSSRRPTHAPANIVLPSTQPSATVSQPSRA